MNPFERFLCWQMKIADFLVSKNSTWGHDPLEAYWQRELIVMHPFRIFVQSIYLFPIGLTGAVAGWLGILASIYYFLLGIVTWMPPYLIAGIVSFAIAYVLACLCTAFVAKHILMLSDFLILLFRHQKTSGTIIWTNKTRSGTPASPVHSWHIKVSMPVPGSTWKKQECYGRTQISGLHDWLEPGLVLNNSICIAFDPKRVERARVIYSKK